MQFLQRIWNKLSCNIIVKFVINGCMQNIDTNADAGDGYLFLRQLESIISKGFECRTAKV